MAATSSHGNLMRLIIRVLRSLGDETDHQCDDQFENWDRKMGNSNITTCVWLLSVSRGSMLDRHSFPR